MIKTAIVEDERDAAERLKAFLTRYSAESGEAFGLRFFETGAKLLSSYDLQFDLIFMDIDMPEMDGLKTAERLRTIDPAVGLVFITNLARYAIKGYEYEAIDYILKPLSYPSFKLKLDRILTRVNRHSKSAFITISTRTRQDLVEVNSVYYVEVSGHDVIYHTENGDFTAYGTLKNASKDFPSHQFVRCNSCYLVNLAHVSGFDGTMLKVGGRLIEISRSRRRELLEAFNRYRIGGSGQ